MGYASFSSRYFLKLAIIVLERELPQWNGSFGYVHARIHTHTHTYVGIVTAF